METPKPEYQHFIPQFLIKNFSHSSVFYIGREGRKTKKRHKLAVNVLDMSSTPFHIDEQPVNRVCGVYDMYVDEKVGGPGRRRIEKKFGALEGKASRIYHKIIENFKARKDMTWLTREEVYLVRKFLFLLLFRGDGLHKKWNHNSIDDFPNQDGDKEMVRRYMAENGITRPVDVWLHSLETILDLHVDAEKKWTDRIKEKIFPPDAWWMVDFFGSTYLTVCTPDNPDDEFILTENSFLISEGSIKNYRNPVTGENHTESATFHKLAPISPRLMFILRSNFLPELAEDANPEAREFRETIRVVSQALGMTTMLEDLPVRKAINSYTHTVQGQLRAKPGWDGKFRDSDMFGFKIFRIPTRHMQKINGLLIDHAYHGSRIIFDDSEKFLNLVQWYLEEPCKVGKNVYGKISKPLIAHIRNLITFMENSKRVVHPLVNVWPTKDIFGVEFFTLASKDAIRHAERMIRRDYDRSFEGTYCAFGGTKEMLSQDLEYSVEALKFARTCISRETPRQLQEPLKRIFMDKLYGTPIARAWVFLKRLRFRLAIESFGIRSRYDPRLYDDRQWQGPEDFFANGDPDDDPTAFEMLMVTTAFTDMHNVSPFADSAIHFREQRPFWQNSEKVWTGPEDFISHAFPGVDTTVPDPVNNQESWSNTTDPKTTNSPTRARFSGTETDEKKAASAEKIDKRKKPSQMEADEKRTNLARNMDEKEEFMRWKAEIKHPATYTQTKRVDVIAKVKFGYVMLASVLLAIAMMLLSH